MSELLYGRNAVREALRARRRTFHRLVITNNNHDRALADLAKRVGVATTIVERATLNAQLPQVNHQGVALEVGNYPYISLEECLDIVEQRNEPAFLLLLDHLQDPQNVGTLLRTAEAVGIHGVLIPDRRAAHITPAVVNASSGATEHLPIALIGNVAQTMKILQQHGIWLVGIEQDQRAHLIDHIDLTIPLALILGAEGHGLARLTRERCDYLLRLPMRGMIESLNVSVAGSIVLYHTWRQRVRQPVEL